MFDYIIQIHLIYIFKYNNLFILLIIYYSMNEEMKLKRKKVKRLYEKWVKHISQFYFHGYPKFFTFFLDSEFTLGLI